MLLFSSLICTINTKINKNSSISLLKQLILSMKKPLLKWFQTFSIPSCFSLGFAQRTRATNGLFCVLFRDIKKDINGTQLLLLNTSWLHAPQMKHGACKESITFEYSFSSTGLIRYINLFRNVLFTVLGEVTPCRRDKTRRVEEMA